MSAHAAVAGNVNGSGVDHVEDQEVVGEISPRVPIRVASPEPPLSSSATDPPPAVSSLSISTSTSPPTALPLSSGTSTSGVAPSPLLPEPPAYYNNPSPPSSLSSRSPSPPPPPLPPSPTYLRPLPATRPASFPLITNLPSFTPRPYTFHASSSPPPVRHSVAIDIFPEADTDPSPDEEPLPTYSRFPKRGESHCMGEVGESAEDDNGSDPEWEDGMRRSPCFGSLYMRTMVAGVVLLILACVITGGVVGWQMKAKYALPSDLFLAVILTYLPLTLYFGANNISMLMYPLQSCHGILSS